MKKLIKLLLICILVIIAIQTAVLADDSIDTNVTIGKTPAIHESDDIIKSMLGVLQAIGSVVSVIALSIIGIRYMFSSLEEKAKMKGVMIYYIIGAVMVFATSNILGVIYNTIIEIKY